MSIMSTDRYNEKFTLPIVNYKIELDRLMLSNNNTVTAINMNVGLHASEVSLFDFIAIRLLRITEL